MADEVGVDGQSVADVARRHGLHPSVLGRWCARYGKRTPYPPPAAATFVPVTVTVPEAKPMPVPPDKSGRGEGVIEVVLANGRRLVAAEGIAPSRLRLLIAAVEAA